MFQIKATAQCVGSASRTTDLKGLVVQWPALLPSSSLCVWVQSSWRQCWRFRIGIKVKITSMLSFIMSPNSTFKVKLRHLYLVYWYAFSGKLKVIRKNFLFSSRNMHYWFLYSEKEFIFGQHLQILYEFFFPLTTTERISNQEITACYGGPDIQNTQKIQGHYQHKV